jgi:hypothetical protein
MPAKRERAVTWWNPAAQTRPVFDLSSFAPVLTLPHRMHLHSASSVLAVHISCRDIAVFVSRKPLFISWTLSYLCMLHKYSVRYYLRFHVSAVRLGTYYLRVGGHTCMHFFRSAAYVLWSDHASCIIKVFVVKPHGRCSWGGTDYEISYLLSGFDEDSVWLLLKMMGWQLLCTVGHYLPDGKMTQHNVPGDLTLRDVNFVSFRHCRI